jgi:hypothetical protein
MEYVMEHPTPWRIIGGWAFDHVDPNDKVDPNGEVETAQVWGVVDANNVRVLPECEPSPMVAELVDFVNTLGPILPSLPHLMRVSQEEAIRREYERRWAGMKLTEEEKQRIKDNVRRKYPGTKRGE